MKLDNKISTSLIRKIISVVLVVVLVMSQMTPALAATKKPKITARGAIVYCQNTGDIIYSKNMNKQLAPYSITKLMTALLAAQSLSLDKEVTISAEAAAEGESTMDLVEGEVVTVRDLLYGTLILSGNDAAYALAEAVSGSKKKFVKLMNKTAKNIGCTDTHFMNPNGMKEDDHYTSAYDMMLITKAALSNDIVREVAGTKKYSMEKTNKSKKRTMKTHLPLINKSEYGVYAGKTGYWGTDDCSVAFGFEEDGLQMIIVLIGDTEDERTNDMKSLITYGKSKIEGVRVVEKDEVMGMARVRHGEKTRVEAVTKDMGYAYLPKEASQSLIKTNVVMRGDIKAPVEKGTVVGTLEIYAADELVNTVDLLAKEDIETGWFPSYVGISNKATIIICAVIVILLIFRIWFTAYRAKRRRQKRMARQKKIEQMAREELMREKERNERNWHF